MGCGSLLLTSSVSVQHSLSSCLGCLFKLDCQWHVTYGLRPVDTNLSQWPFSVIYNRGLFLSTDVGRYLCKIAPASLRMGPGCSRPLFKAASAARRAGGASAVESRQGHELTVRLRQRKGNVPPLVRPLRTATPRAPMLYYKRCLYRPYCKVRGGCQ